MENLYLGPVLPANEVRTIGREELQSKLGSGALKLVMCRPERYAGGLVDWEDAGLPLEGTSVKSPRVH
jgi:hypothetical protein